MLSALFHAPTLSSLSLSNSSLSSRSSMAAKARIAVVGDVHNYWNLEDDTKALELLKPDLVLFTGTYLNPISDMSRRAKSGLVMRDFGEENVELVQSVADLKFPKAAILGNHDAWYTLQFSKKKKDGVQQQLESLGDAHVAYKCLDFPLLKLSIVGGRPFSCGGSAVFRKKLLSARTNPNILDLVASAFRYGVEDMDTSAKRIHKAALKAPEDHLVVLLAHNGPAGLGSNLDDICGKDWVFEAGDHGDQDLKQAISLLKDSNGASVPLVVFGHMHKELAYGNGLRKMIVVGSDDTIYLNGAVVPRVKTLISKQSTSENSLTEDLAKLSLQEPQGSMRAFTLVDILDGKVDKISETWVSVVGDNAKLEEEHLLFKRSN